MEKRFDDLVKRQREYNVKIRDLSSLDRIEWTQTYLLGMISEVDEVLREINWKKHRMIRNEPPNLVNIALELSDLTKYILSLWELWGFSSKDILYYTEIKSRSLELQTSQEKDIIPDGKPVLICDLDGTIADWRSTFVEWLKSKGINPIDQDNSYSLMIDNDLSMLYSDYYDLKEEFESSGQYRYVKMYEDSRKVLSELKSTYDCYIIAITARPSERYSRIWIDTWLWIEYNSLPVDKLIIGSESRILLAHSLKDNGKDVIMFEDNPGLITRGANNGIRVFSRRHSYNRGISSSGVRIVDSYEEVDISEYFPKSYSKERKG